MLNNYMKPRYVMYVKIFQTLPFKKNNYKYILKSIKNNQSENEGVCCSLTFRMLE